MEAHENDLEKKELAAAFAALPVVVRFKVNANAFAALRDACHHLVSLQDILAGVPIIVDPDIPLDGKRVKAEMSDGSVQHFPISSFPEEKNSK
jgi:hypothetical protein